MKLKVFAVEQNGPDGIDNMYYVAANDREEVISLLLDKVADSQYERHTIQHCSDVMWLEGAVYEATVPCIIESRLCTNNGVII